jgi:formylglycine-generating enzyme required for sulfatase activity
LKLLPYRSDEQPPLAIDSTKSLDRAQLLEAIRNLFLPQGEEPPDVAFLYFSGHGRRLCQDNEFTGERECESYLSCSDDEYAIPFSGLQQILTASRARNKLVWLDCCHSGDPLLFKPLFDGQSGLFIASSRASEESLAEKNGYGFLTRTLLNALEEVLFQKGVVTTIALLAALEDRMKGGPQTWRFGVQGTSIEVLRKDAARALERRREQADEPWTGVDASVREIYKNYLRRMCQECERLPIQSIDPDLPFSHIQVGTTNLFFDLRLIPTAYDRNPQDRSSMQVLSPAGAGEPAFEVLGRQEHRFTILRGVLGSGKSTLLSVLALKLSEAQLDGEAAELAPGLAGRLPVRVVLGEAVSELTERGSVGTADDIWRLIHAQLWDEDNSTSEALSRAAALVPVLRNHGLFLFDGLDEVPERGGCRQRLLEGLHVFSGELASYGARIVLATRPYALLGEHYPRLDRFSVLDIASLLEEQIDEFVAKWMTAAAPTLKWRPEILARRVDELTAELHERAYLADLARRPLLLTLIASLHTRHVQLPENRATLFEAAVSLFLTRWHLALQEKEHEGLPRVPAHIADLLQSKPERIRAGLQQVAQRIHERQGKERASGGTTMDISLEEAYGIFTTVLPDHVAAKPVLKYLDERAGLLQRQPEGGYSFVHRSFQEYLAACNILDHSRRFGQELAEHALKDMDWWREVFLLGLGKVSLGSIGNALTLVGLLVRRDKGDVPKPSEDEWRSAVLAGLAASELRFAEQANDLPLAGDLEKRIVDWLLALLRGDALSAPRRAEAGDVLGRLGDPRPGTGVVEACRPGIEWVGIQGGSFDIGPEEVSESTEIAPFEIGRYPVTVAQFQCFIDAGGYDKEQLWRADGWQWRQATKRNSPTRWFEQRRYLNRPVSGVTWYEAMAFCSWMRNQTRRMIGLPWPKEWELAARGLDGRCYPWGNDPWDETRANFDGSKIGHPSAVGIHPKGKAPEPRTSAVGIHPEGETPEGVHDLAGNVWEWCEPDPDVFDDGAVKDEASQRHVARGGSWWSPAATVCSESTKRFPPWCGDPDLGFRLVRRERGE